MRPITCPHCEMVCAIEVVQGDTSYHHVVMCRCTHKTAKTQAAQCCTCTLISTLSSDPIVKCGYCKEQDRNAAQKTFIVECDITGCKNIFNGPVRVCKACESEAAHSDK